MAVAIVAGLADWSVASAQPASFVPPRVEPIQPVPVAAVPVTPASRPASPPADKPDPVWPTGSAVADLTRSEGSAQVLRGEGLPPFFARGRAGDLPVVFATGNRALGSVQVEVLDRTTTQRANLRGLLMRVRPAKTSASASVDVSIEYGGFATAFGGDWSSRLRLFSVPQCALSTPSRRQCAPTPVASRNDLSTKTVTASVPIGPGLSLFALEADESGPAGDYSATKLQPSSTWQAGGNSGAFSWNYPMRVPPAPGGPAPALALSYSSQSVDGRHAATNNQPSWVGEGFEFTPGGFIERRYKPCSKDMGGQANNIVESGDQCWETDNATLSLSGHSGELIYNAVDARWHLRTDDGTRIQRFVGAANGDNDGEHWVVTTTDGTQFWFGLNRLPGWATGDPETNSTLTTPVFGNEPGEPCHATTFADSDCTQAWRWNLDYVVDINDNSASYWYVKEANHYGRNNDPNDAAVYDRDAYLSHITYGTRRNTAPDPDVDSVLDSPAPAKVVFTAADRCLNSCGDHDEAAWPDTPWDGDCAAAPCLFNAPTYWTTKRLSTVTTQVWNGSDYSDVERWTFTHTFPDPGDGTRAGLWLAAISHTGLVGTTTAVPDIEFTGTQLPNRVDTTGDFAAAMNWWRVSMIRNETGGTISVTYSDPDCVAGQPMPEPHTNTRRCYPVRWTPDGYLSPVTDWFHKYVVTTIYEEDHTGGAPPKGSPRVVYQYSYLDGAAWHYTDDDGLIDPDSKTWSQWRGYGRVGVTVGDPGEQTYTETRYLRGMHGDTLPSGTRTVMVPGTGVPDVPDEDAYAGMVREHTVFNGPNGAVVTRDINEPWQSPATATRTINGTTVHSRYVSTSASHKRTTLDGGRPERVTTTLTSFDNYGTPVEVEELGDVAIQGDEKCTRTAFEPRNTTAWLMKSAHSVARYAVNCATAANPPATLSEDDVIGETRMSYDGQTWNTAPVRGLQTRVEQISAWNNGSPVFLTTQRLAYDSHGRVTQSWNAINALTTTTYTPAAGGLVTQIKSRNPLNHETTTTFEPAWGAATSIVDPNGKRTDVAFDGLGRTTAVWKPGRDKATETPTVTFGYLLRTDGPTAVSTSVLHGSGQYSTAYTLYDGLLRTRQTQVPSPSGGRILTDTFYDTAGRQSRSYASYYALGTPGTELATAIQPATVPTQSTTMYDGAGRVVASVFHPYDVVQWTAITAYGGDRIDVTPPPGGTATSTITDVREYVGGQHPEAGKTVELRQYHGATPTPNVGGSWDATISSYDRKGQLRQVTDAAGNNWTFTYDIRGRQTTWTDPDKGTTTSTWDNANRLASTTDSRGVTLSYTYDPLDRKRVAWLGQPGTGTQRAQWIYDTIAKGQLTQSTRIDGTRTYQSRILEYNDNYQPTKTQVIIPTFETGLSGIYNLNYTYDPIDGSLLSQEFINPNGDLPAETLTYSYDNIGQPVALDTVLAPSTNISLVAGTAYNALGHIDQITLDTDDTAGGRVYRSYTRELETGRTTGIRTDRDSLAPNTVADLTYTYDAAGNITKLTDSATEPVDDNQCFTYDQLRRLTEAWTPANGDCSTEPQAALIDGPAPYWHSWQIDAVGNRESQTIHAIGGGTDATTTYDYPPAGGSQPHTLIATTGAASGTYTYDPAGNTTCRPTGTTANNCATGADSQTLTWDAEGHLATSTDSTGTTSYLYDADGNRLIQRDPTGTTLYLSGQEFRYTTATGTTTCTRYYTFAGETIASRTSTGLHWLSSDHQGTTQVAINQATQTADIRRHTPYGEPRGNTPAWPNTKGFVGGTADSSGLTHLGAREYDSRTGRFLTLDPVFGSEDPQQLHGYAYANNSPVTFSDPSGYRYDAGGGEACGHLGGHCPWDGPIEIGDEVPPAGEMTDEYASQMIFGRSFEDVQNIFGHNDVLTVKYFVNCYNTGETCDEAVQSLTPDSGLLKELALAITGIGDAIDCAGGSTSGCAWLAVGFIPFSKFGKIAKAFRHTGDGFDASAHLDDLIPSYSRDEIGRPSTVQVTLTEKNVGGLSDVRVEVPGRGPGMHRAHLLGALLGGSNKDPRNFVALYAYANTPIMRDLERMVYNAVVKDKEVVRYSVTPIYRGTDVVPTGVTISAQGSGGFSLEITIRNLPKL